MRRLLFLLAILAIALLPAFSIQKPNILFITIDTLRADRLGSYGYKSAQTPSIDQLAREGIQFSNVFSPVPLTRPSHISIFTSLYPYQHGIHDNVAPPLSKEIPTLAEILETQGYSTAGFVASFVINSQSGLQRGFNTYADEFDPQKQPTQFALNLEKRGDQVYNEFQKWMARNKNRPYFAWIHLYDPHFPYAPPPPYSSKFAQRPYDGEVAYTDSVIGKILKLTDQNTLLVLTSDHGESLGDHGENAHSFFIYDATLHVPLLFRWPGMLKTGTKISIQARLIDIFPTLLDLLSMPVPKKISGISLKPWLLDPQKKDPDLPSYSETFTPWLHFGWSPLQGVRRNGWKYIQAPQPELYNVLLDPGEMRNRILVDRTKAEELKQWLAGTGAALEKQAEGMASPELDPEELEKLASLGYAGVPTTPSSFDPAKLADPKQKLGDFKLFNQLIREGIENFQKEKYQEAAVNFRTLKEKNIPSFEIYYYLGRSLLRLKSYDNASTELELAIQKLPHFLPAYRDLSEAYEGRGNLQKAEQVLLEGLKASPYHPSLVQPLAWFYQKQKRYQEAEKLLVQELKVHPDDLESRFRLGAIFRDTGRTEAAISQFKEIIAQKPDDAEAHNQLGMLYGGSARWKEAIAEFQIAQKLDPANQNVRHNLQLALQRSKNVVPIRFRIIQTHSRAAADSLLRKLQAGEDWNVVAKNYSIHPSARSANTLLELLPADVDPVLLKGLSALKTGEISSVFQTPSGFFILRKE